jgi:hypothetical protein
MRKTWKAISKSTKRKALWQSEYKLNPNSPAELFHDEPIPDGQAGAQARRVIEE